MGIAQTLLADIADAMLTELRDALSDTDCAEGDDADAWDAWHAVGLGAFRVALK